MKELESPQGVFREEYLSSKVEQFYLTDGNKVLFPNMARTPFRQ